MSGQRSVRLDGEAGKNDEKWFSVFQRKRLRKHHLLQQHFDAKINVKCLQKVLKRRRNSCLIIIMSFPGRAVQRTWHLVDASSQTVGRLATTIAPILKGKHKPTFRPNGDCGDYVVVVNADKVCSISFTLCIVWYKRTVQHLTLFLLHIKGSFLW